MIHQSIIKMHHKVHKQVNERFILKCLHPPQLSLAHQQHISNSFKFVDSFIKLAEILWLLRYGPNYFEQKQKQTNQADTGSIVTDTSFSYLRALGYIKTCIYCALSHTVLRMRIFSKAAILYTLQQHYHMGLNYAGTEKKTAQLSKMSVMAFILY